jgi:hypothetical protein
VANFKYSPSYFAPEASYFLLLAQKKVTKEKSTPSRLFLALLGAEAGDKVKSVEVLALAIYSSISESLAAT